MNYLYITATHNVTSKNIIILDNKYDERQYWLEFDIPIIFKTYSEPNAIEYHKTFLANHFHSYRELLELKERVYNFHIPHIIFKHNQYVLPFYEYRHVNKFTALGTCPSSWDKEKNRHLYINYQDYHKFVEFCEEYCKYQFFVAFGKIYFEKKSDFDTIPVLMKLMDFDDDR